MSGDISMTGSLHLDGRPLLHNHATQRHTFVGRQAGDLATLDEENTDMGDSALDRFARGDANAAVGGMPYT